MRARGARWEAPSRPAGGSPPAGLPRLQDGFVLLRCLGERFVSSPSPRVLACFDLQIRLRIGCHTFELTKQLLVLSPGE